MSLINKIPGVVFTQLLPKLYRDAVIGTSTLAAYDTVNTASWPFQVVPVAGDPSASKWINLVSGAADGAIHTNGGFTFNRGFVATGVNANSIRLFNGAVPATPAKLLGIIWLKHGTQVGTSQDSILNLAQWMEIRFAQVAQTNVAAGRFFISGGSITANREIPLVPVVGSVYQLAAFYESATRVLRAYVNGVEVFTNAGFADLPAGHADGLRVASRTGITNVYIGTYYRPVVDTLADGRTAAEVVALDYALNNARFS